MINNFKSIFSFKSFVEFFIIIFLIFWVAFSSLNSLFASPRKTSKCESILSYGDTFHLKDQADHRQRALAEEVDMRRVRILLSRLSGKINLDSDGAISGRATDEQRERVRNFLESVMQELGLESHREEFTLEEKIKPPRDDDDDDVRPLDVKKANMETIIDVWGSSDMRDLKKFLFEVKKMSNPGADFLRTITIDQLNTWEEEIEEKIKCVEKQVKEAHARGDQICDLNWALSDLKKLRARMKAAEKKSKKRKPLIIEHHIVNIVVDIQGTEWPDEIIELVAHYDTAGEEIPGADDNGSGISTLLEAARIFSQHPPKRTLRLVFSDLEEHGFLGSKGHAKLLAEKNSKNILGAVVLDTIGYAPLGRHEDVSPPFVLEVGTRNDHETPISYQKSVMLAQVFAYQFERYADRDITLKLDTYSAKPDTADHGSYWETGVPAILIAAPYEGSAINPGYHGKGDVMEQMNWGYFESMIRFIVEGVSTLTEVPLSKVKIKEYLGQEGVQYVEEVSTPADPTKSRVDVEPKRSRRSRRDRDDDDDEGSSHSASKSWLPPWLNPFSGNVEDGIYDKYYETKENYYNDEK